MIGSSGDKKYFTQRENSHTLMWNNRIQKSGEENKMKSRLGFVGILLAASLLSAGAGAQSVGDCAALKGLELPGTALEVANARIVPEGIPPPAPFAPPIQKPLPAHCLLE